MSAKKKTYVCTHDLSVVTKKGDGFELIKAGTPIPESKLLKETIDQYVAGGLLSEYKESEEASVSE